MKNFYRETTFILNDGAMIHDGQEKLQKTPKNAATTV